MTKPLFISFWLFFYGVILISWLGVYRLSLSHMYLHDHVSSIFLMWALMVLAMMVPTIIPHLRFYINLRYTKSRDVGNVHLTLFMVAYILGWLIYATMATIVQYVFDYYQLLNHQGTIVDRPLSLMIIVIAAIYNVLPGRLKTLSKCQSPMVFFMTYWKPGYKTAFHLGWRYSIDCIKCCWVLMALMFVGAMENLLFMLALTAVMVIEKFPISKNVVSYVTSFILLILVFWII